MLNSLFEIASNVQIEANFCIRHPNYQAFALETEVAERFQQTSTALQQKFLTMRLRNFLHGIYYNASLQTTLAVNGDVTNDQRYQNLDNSNLGIDGQFYELLHKSNNGIGYFDPNWQVVGLEPDGSLAVIKGGLTLYVEREYLKEPTMPSVKGGNIAIWMPKNRLQNGFYIALSNVGQEQLGYPDADLGVGRIYFNLTPSGAIALMKSLTLQLNAVAIPFSFQVLSHPSAYGRYDSGILYFERNDYPSVREVLQDVYLEHQSHFHKPVPLFTKFLAPGLSLAEEPTQKFALRESFGLNRCHVVATALLEAWQKGKNSTEERINTICQHFSRQGIDLQRPYLNPYSEDIYFPLN
ncbi:MAG: T3SS effector HopA1 family protein [Rhizonema sp. NSF051]|nr:T3SS effector HopA1 family protein [Rhizonema sp. NSF051]